MAVWSITSSPTWTVIWTIQSKPPNCSLAASWGLYPIWRCTPDAGDRYTAWRETARHCDLATTMQHFCSPRISTVTPDRPRAAICPLISSKLTRGFLWGINGAGIWATKMRTGWIWTHFTFAFPFAPKANEKIHDSVSDFTKERKIVNLPSRP